MIDALRKQVENQRVELSRYAQLDKQMLKQKPQDGGWSMLECIGHMNLATELYLDQINAKKHKFKEADRTYKPTFLAKHFIKGLGVQNDGSIKFKMKTMKVFDPSEQPTPDENAIQRLNENFDRIFEILDIMEGKDPRSFKVVTALGPILKFYVGDAMRFINAHNERHFLQLSRIFNKVQEKTAQEV